MKRLSMPFLFAGLAFSLFLTSCDAGKLNKKAEETANNFYTELQQKDYASAINLCSSEAFKTDSKEAWTTAFKRNAGMLGNIKSFAKTSGFNISTSTSNGTTVTMLYDVQWQYGKTKDSVILNKESDGSMKVIRYSWDYKEAKYLTELDASEQQAKQYMNALKTGDYNSATALCSEQALAATPREQWIAMLQNASAQLGTVSAYNIVKDSTTYTIDGKGGAGEGNYYNVVVQSQRGDSKVMEKMVFFQKDYEEPVKLMGHYFL